MKILRQIETFRDHALMFHYNNIIKMFIYKRTNLLHYNLCKAPKCFGHFCVHFQGIVFKKVILQRQPNQCTNMKY